MVVVAGSVTLLGAALAGLGSGPAPVAAPGPAAGPTSAAPSEVPADTEPWAEPIGAESAYVRPVVTVPESGAGDFVVVPAAAGRRQDEGAITYTMEIESGLRFDRARSARTIARILADERGWQGPTFRQVDAAGDLRILLATPGTTDALCAPLLTNGEVSCRNGDLVVLNARRWTFGIGDYDGALPAYRTYLVNHEVGHAIGYGHEACPGPGEPAPVMQQQSYGLDGCVRNPWPSAG